MSRAQFESAVSDLDQRIPELTDPEAIVGMMRIVAMAGDGHTAIWPAFRPLPISLRWFEDGLFVTGAPAETRRARGARVVQIGDMDVQKTCDLVSPVISHDNDWAVRDQSARRLTMHEVLYALRIVGEPSKARHLLEDATGGRFPLEVVPGQGVATEAPDPATGFVPHWRRNTDLYYWFEHLESSRTLYLAYNGIPIHHMQHIWLKRAPY